MRCLCVNNSRETVRLLPTSKFPDAESRREEAIRLMETGNFQRYNQTTVRLPPSSCSLIHDL